MKLYTFEIGSRCSIGAECNGQLVDLPAAYAAMRSARDTQAGHPTALPPDMLAFIQGGEPAWTMALETVAFIAKRPALPVGERATYLFDEVRLIAPLPRPGKILCSGINYHSHQQENPSAKFPEEPFFFSKLPSAVVGPGAPVEKPAQTEQMDYEVEFAVVIGKPMKATPEAEVMDCLFGYTILHDLSARDVQFKDSQITLGKNFDGFCPLGPCIVTTDELPDPGNVGLRSYVNGQLMQNGSTRDWLFPLPMLLNRLSCVMTLEPGDVVSTGTPAGVGVFRKPPVFLKPGDVVRLEVDGVGSLENPIVAKKRTA
jgi:2-keto-4-pentenoate hydratase/2-oxohepta-3-ene-1,7-dioic acid hydratase in catechol pathway